MFTGEGCSNCEWASVALKAGGVGLWCWDRRTGDVRWDEAMESLYRLPAGSFGGRFDDWVQCIHPDDRDEVLARLETILRYHGGHRLLYRTLCPDGAVRWIESNGRVVREAQGDAVGIVGVCHDVTDRRQAEAHLRETEQRTRQRLEFLAEVGEVLGRASIDLNETLQEFTDLVVPRLSDWCAVDLVERDELRLVAVANADPSRLQLAQELLERYGRTADRGAGRVVRTGQTQYHPEITDEMLRAAASDERHLEMLRKLRLSSMVQVPLRARDRVLGALTLAYTDSGRRYDKADVTLAQELARRAAVAIDNAKLLGERSRVADMLQQALLPPALPEVPGVELASRYHATEQVDIGGDFYDVLGADDGWTLLIGDVCGKGVKAASLTSLARHTVRAAALQGPDPLHMLDLLNEALLKADAEDGYCTAVCARLGIGEGAAVMAVAAAGHPPPLVRRADGTVEQVDAAGLLLGSFYDLEIAPVTVVLQPGDLVLFYTDGVTDVRRDHELFGVERLEAALADTAGLGADATLKHLHHAVEEWRWHQPDDIAMMACRLRS